MKRTIIILLLIIMNVISCQENKGIDKGKSFDGNIKKIDTIEIKENYIKDYYKKNITSLEEDEDYYMSEKDIELMIPIIAKNLIREGFKPISETEFNNKVRSIFNIDFKNDKCYKIFKHKDFITYSMGQCDNLLPAKCRENNKLLEFLNGNNLILIKRYNYITSLPLLWEIIRIENNQLHVHIPQKIVSRNKYLFNEDKSQFKWLIKNDSDFMNSLVKHFGYTKDKELLNWVFDNSYFPSYSYENISFTPEESAWKIKAVEYGKLLWTKYCSGDIKIHQETLDLLDQKIKTAKKSLEAPIYLSNIYNYIIYLVNQEPKELGITFEQKSKILAHLLYFGEKYSHNPEYKNLKLSDNSYYGDVEYAFMIYFLKIRDEEYNEEFKLNNYYNLPYFKEWFEKAKENRRTL